MYKNFCNICVTNFVEKSENTQKPTKKMWKNPNRKSVKPTIYAGFGGFQKKRCPFLGNAKTHIANVDKKAQTSLVQRRREN